MVTAVVTSKANGGGRGMKNQPPIMPTVTAIHLAREEGFQLVSITTSNL